MARRSDHSREELTAMAIAAGQVVISNEGLSQFSARKVAKNIGYTVGTLYNIFGSYDDLILHINAATLDDLLRYITQGAPAQKPVTPQARNPDCSANSIKKLTSSYISFANENYYRWGALFEFNLPQETPLPMWYREKINALFATVETLLLPLTRDSNKTKHAAKVLWAGVHGICQLGLTGKLETIEAGSIQTLTDSLIDNYIQGLVRQRKEK